jgi:hypothetical protein
MRGAREAAHGKIETGGTILTFIVTIRIKFDNVILLLGVPQDVYNRSVDLCISPSALLIRKPACVSHALHHETMLDLVHVRFIDMKPGN